MNSRSCQYQGRIAADSAVFRCGHVRVRTFTGLVNAEICRACQWRAPIADSPTVIQPPATTRTPLPKAENGRTANGTAAATVVAQTPAVEAPVPLREMIIQGCMEVPYGPRPVYECDVVIPYYKRLEWLPQAIDSILWQANVSCRIHLVNDDSPEDDRWVRKHYRGHPSLFWYRNTANLGPFQSVHAVWDQLTTKYLALQDADDLSLPHRLWRAIHALETRDAEIYGAAMEQFIDPHVGKLRDSVMDYARRRPQLTSQKSGLPTIPVSLVNGTMVIRRDTFERLNGFAEYHCGSDDEFYTRAYYAGAKFFLDRVTAGLRRIHTDNISRSEAQGVGSDYNQQVRSAIAEIHRDHLRDGDGFDFRRFGTLDRPDRGRKTLNLQTEQPLVTTGPHRLARVVAGAVDHLEQEGFVGREPRLLPALLPLMQFVDGEAFLRTLSKSVRSDERAARNHQLSCRFFEPRNHSQDLYEIVRSRPERQGRPMREAVLENFQSIGHPSEGHVALTPIHDPQNFHRWIGVFQPLEGHRQGNVQTNERLLGFILLNRKSELAFYTTIMGHGDYLKWGIMFALHLHIMKWLLSREEEATRGIQFLMYSAWQDGQSGLRRWKERAGFAPFLLHATSVRETPREIGPPQPFPLEAMTGIRSAAAFFCAAFGGVNDVVHLRDRGLRDVTLIDANYERMVDMRRDYPETWEYLVGDAFEAVQKLGRERTYDLVVCDQWSQQFEQVALARFADFHRLANVFLVMTVVPRWADAKGHDATWFAAEGLDYSFYTDVRDCFDGGAAEETARRLSEIFSQRHGVAVSVERVMRRSDYLGGCYWMVIGKTPSTSGNHESRGRFHE